MLFTDQCMHWPREGRGRKRQTPPIKEKEQGRGESLPRYEQETARTNQRGSPLHPTKANPPTRGGGGTQERQPHNREATHPFHQGRQPLQSGKTTARDHPAQPNEAQQDKADHHGHAANDRPEERRPWTGRHRPRRARGGAATTETRTQQGPPAGKQSRKKKQRGGRGGGTKGTTAGTGNRGSPNRAYPSAHNQAKHPRAPVPLPDRARAEGTGLHSPGPPRPRPPSTSSTSTTRPSRTPRTPPPPFRSSRWHRGRIVFPTSSPSRNKA